MKRPRLRCQQILSSEDRLFWFVDDTFLSAAHVGQRERQLSEIFHKSMNSTHEGTVFITWSFSQRLACVFPYRWLDFTVYICAETTAGQIKKQKREIEDNIRHCQESRPKSIGIQLMACPFSCLLETVAVTCEGCATWAKAGSKGRVLSLSTRLLLQLQTAVTGIGHAMGPRRRELRSSCHLLSSY